MNPSTFLRQPGCAAVVAMAGQEAAHHGSHDIEIKVIFEEPGSEKAHGKPGPSSLANSNRSSDDMAKTSFR